MCDYERGTGLKQTFKNSPLEPPQLCVQRGKVEVADHLNSGTDCLGSAANSGPVVTLGESLHLVVSAFLSNEKLFRLRGLNEYHM